MKNLESTDKKFLLLSSSVILTLILLNFPLFIKSIASSKFAIPEIKRAARQIKLTDFRNNEQQVWNKLKEVNFEQIVDKNNVVSLSQEISPVNQESENKVPVDVYSQTDIEIQPGIELKLDIDPVIDAVPDIKLNTGIELISSIEPASAGELTPAAKLNIKNTQASQTYARFLLIGDSTMYDLGIVLDYNLRKFYHVNNVMLDYKVSTGLNRIDYYDWYARTPQVIDSYKPDVLVVIFGGNDDQDILDSHGKYNTELTDGWKEAYRERVEKYAKLVSESSLKKIYWIGQPISNVSRYNQFYPVLNQIFQEVTQKYPKIQFVDTWNAFALDGKFSATMPDKSGKTSYVRISDGVHFTEHGSRILGSLILDKMLEDATIYK